MTIEEKIVSALNTITSYPNFNFSKPNDLNNCIVYKIISPSQPYRSMDKNLPLKKYHIQVDCWGNTQTITKTIASLVLAKMDLNKTDFILSYCDSSYPDKEIDTGLYREILQIIIFDN